MKVRISFEVDVDVEAHRLNYGEATLAEIRSDVQKYAQMAIEDHFDHLGILTRMTV